jgi:hypothetical protein
MSDRTFVYIIVAIVVAHFLFAVAYLLWKIYSAPHSKDALNETEVEQKNKP